MGYRRPSWTEYFLNLAELISTRSTCDRLQVGCVLVSGGSNPNRIIATGYNGFPAGAPHESVMRDGHEQATIHAEQNAVSDSARRGVTTDGCTAYITHYPCVNCAKILIAAGVKQVVYAYDYRNDDVSTLLLRQAGIVVTQSTTPHVNCN